MKVIDLLNKIANGETPKMIKYKKKVYQYKDIMYERGYLNIDEAGHYNWFEKYIDVESEDGLNEEVEMLEDKEMEEIKELNFTQRDMRNLNGFGFIEYEPVSQAEMQDKINEIIRVVNRMQEERKQKNGRSNDKINCYDK